MCVFSLFVLEEWANLIGPTCKKKIVFLSLPHVQFCESNSEDGHFMQNFRLYLMGRKQMFICLDVTDHVFKWTLLPSTQIITRKRKWAHIISLLSTGSFCLWVEYPLVFKT